MRVPAGRAGLVRLWCWLYIGIGLCSLAAGIFMAQWLHSMGKDAPQGAGYIAFVLILFGPLRIANSAWVLYTVRRRRADG